MKLPRFLRRFQPSRRAWTGPRRERGFPSAGSTFMPPPATSLSQLAGVPYLTVSPIGSSTSGVTLKNNGADYGPDTPGTTTSGIVEALTAGASNGLPIKGIPVANFYISTLIDLSAIYPTGAVNRLIMDFSNCVIQPTANLSVVVNAGCPTGKSFGNCEFHFGTIDANSTTSTTGLQLYNMSNCRVYWDSLTNFTGPSSNGVGVSIDSTITVNGNFFDNYVFGSYLSGNALGFQTVGNASASAWGCQGNYMTILHTILNTSGLSIDANQPGKNTIFNTFWFLVVESNTNFGIIVGNSQNVIYCMYTGSNGLDGLLVQAGQTATLQAYGYFRDSINTNGNPCYLVNYSIPPVQPITLGATLQKNETGADANILTVAPPKVAGHFRVDLSIDVSADNTGTLGWTATWTDSNSHAQTPTNLALTIAGTAAPVLTVVAVANTHYYASLMLDCDNSGTNIVIKTTFSGTSIAYKVTAKVFWQG